MDHMSGSCSLQNNGGGWGHAEQRDQHRHRPAGDWESRHQACLLCDVPLHEGPSFTERRLHVVPHEKGPGESPTSYRCASLGAASSHVSGSCTVTMQWSHDSDSCMVFQVVCPAPGKGKSVLDAWVTAINVHQSEDNAREAGGHGKGFFCWSQGRTLDIIVKFGYEWTRSEQQMEAVSWKDVRATIHVREIDVQRRDKSWQVHDSAPTLVESDVASHKAFFDTGRFELTGKQLGPPLLEVDWHVHVCQIVAGTWAEELKQMAAIMQRANAGVRKHGGRASILNKVVAAKECGFSGFFCP